MLNIIICEDDKNQRTALEKKVKQLPLPPLSAVYAFGEADAMLRFCLGQTGDFLFLMDIVLKNDANGIEIVKQINTFFQQAVIIYISAYLEKVTDIFDTQHCYFIYKPELDLRLEKAMRKAIAQLRNKKRTLMVHSGSESLVLPVEDILWIERIKRYSLIHTKTETYRISEDFPALLKQLPGCFQQCHRCFIVNFDWVKKHTRTEFIMKNAQWIPISRGYSKVIQEAFQQYISAV